jgi:hypothetical protein
MRFVYILRDGDLVLKGERCIASMGEIKTFIKRSILGIKRLIFNYENVKLTKGRKF